MAPLGAGVTFRPLRRRHWGASVAVLGGEEHFMTALVTVGLPVFNGERFLPRAIESLLHQDYTSFEIVISDNASTDTTEEICRVYARQDSRIRYYRNPSNLGAANNFNRVVELAQGRYFKWAAHDDWCAPSFLSRCVDELGSDPGTVLCFTAMGVVDDTGAVFRTHRNVIAHMRSPSPQRRLHGVLWTLRDPTAVVFGLIRTDALRRSGMIRNAPEPDRILLGELSLLGGFRRIEDVLFFHYGPPGHSLHYAPATVPPRRREWVWLAPDNAARPKAASLRVLAHHLRAVRGADLSPLARTLCSADVLIATGITRLRGKLRRLAAARRQAISSHDLSGNQRRRSAQATPAAKAHSGDPAGCNDREQVGQERPVEIRPPFDISSR